MESGLYGRSIGVSIVYTDEKDGSKGRKKLIFTPIIINTANFLEPEKDISYEGDKTKFSGKYLFPPQNSCKIIWDMCILFIVITQGIYIPLLIAFEVNPPIGFLYLDFLASLSLILDIFLNFNSGYLRKGAVVMNRNLIIKHYFKTWFFLDLLSSFPYDWLINSSIRINNNYSGTNVANAPRLLRVIKLSKILTVFKLLKLAKVNFYFYKIEDYLNNEIIEKFLTIFRVIIVLVFTAHWNACVWYFVTANFIEEETWLNAMILSSSDVTEDYVNSMYWSIYTMISVGYGDIKLVSVKERILAMFSMAIASGLFGYLFGQISVIIGKQTKRDSDFREIKKNTNLILNKYKVPPGLKSRIKNYVEYAFENHWNYQKEADILECLSIPLREEISHLVNWPAFQHCKLFPKFFQPNIVETFASLFQKFTFSPYDLIIKQNERDRKIFFLVEGCIEIFILQSKRKIEILENKGYFGEIGYFANIPRTANVISMSFSDVLMMDFESTWSSLDKYPSAQKMLTSIEEQCLENLTVIDVRCSFCDRLGHPAVYCFDQNIAEAKENIKEEWLKSKQKSRKNISNKWYHKSNYKRKYRNVKDVVPVFRDRRTSVQSVFKDSESLQNKVNDFLKIEYCEESEEDLSGTKLVSFEDIYEESDSVSSERREAQTLIQRRPPYNIQDVGRHYSNTLEV